MNWLVDRFSLDLSKVARLGGHTYERTHRGNAQFPGMTITVSNYFISTMLRFIAIPDAFSHSIGTKTDSLEISSMLKWKC